MNLPTENKNLQHFSRLELERCLSKCSDLVQLHFKSIGGGVYMATPTKQRTLLMPEYVPIPLRRKEYTRKVVKKKQK